MLSNWAQFWLLMHYLSQLEEDQTLVMYSGHPVGLFPSHRWAPRCVITNGMVRGTHLPRVSLGGRGGQGDIYPSHNSPPEM